LFGLPGHFLGEGSGAHQSLTRQLDQPIRGTRDSGLKTLSYICCMLPEFLANDPRIFQSTVRSTADVIGNTSPRLTDRMARRVRSRSNFSGGRIAGARDTSDRVVDSFLKIGFNRLDLPAHGID
jgi:hypothetical protein